mmetsp:Transcript_29345/g.26812  ORF Transcript_29345/g.26812 Transcript_29345/m.26812 type:complete len:106 (+) Transcript_29345:37-354(+)
MLRKSPYIDENYGYITSMMDNITIKDDFMNQPFENNYNNQNSNFCSMSDENSKPIFQARIDINAKKEIDDENSIFDKTVNMLNQGAKNQNNNNGLFNTQNNFSMF